ncbi:cytochrome b5 isoform [Klebsormidium nitens]|uniref:Cytochrome b5 isoform n=1 Tax=Klebsormidium nitens TaxID=105231 RepID=A0A1Y1IPR6_KLENI|nr:cytochrome b5 isoform [Klebsormidium nitens]|eukprot:GAQ91211.1 cytochrome b5 isoform [Klebsormidium nitens]
MEDAEGELNPQRQRQRLTRRLSMLSKFAEGSGMGGSAATAVTQLHLSFERPAPSAHLRNIPTLSSEEIALIQTSWARVVEVHGIGAISLFYVNLFALAPHLEGLFKRTKGIQEAMFQDMMVTLIDKLHDWEWVVHTLEASAIRHLRYGVSASMFSPVGEALLKTLDMGLGDYWTPATKASWVKMWTAIVAVMSAHLRADGLTRAVANNSFALVTAELERAPRGERVRWMLTKLPSGLTPLLMAIRDKKVRIVKYMLSDILAIRADRTGYYYGRAELWAAHPTIVGEIVENVPTAVKELLDGCYWQSGHSSGGLRRANFYIKGLYGDPDQPVRASPLAQMLNLRGNSAFEHPVTGIIIFQKWNMFGRSAFLRSMMLGCVAFLFLIMGYIALPRQLEGLPFRALFWAYVISDMISEIRRSIAVGCIKATLMGVTVLLPVHFLSVMQFVKLIMTSLVLVSIGFEHTWNKGDGVTESILIATATIAYCFQMLHYYLASNELSSFVFTLSRMLYDLVKFLAVFLLIWIGFALAFYILLRTQPKADGSTVDFTDVHWSFTTFFIMLFGYAEFEFRQIEDRRLQGVAIVLWFIYLMLANLLLLNLLIAQFSTTYEAVYKASYAVALRKLCNELLAIEGTLSVEERRKHYNRLKFDEPLEFDEFDMGPPGGIQLLQDVDPSADDTDDSDRIERYPGKASPDLPWPPRDYDDDSVATNRANTHNPPETSNERGRPQEERNVGSDDKRSPIRFWDNNGQADRFRSVVDVAEGSALTDAEAFYRAGVLRARGAKGGVSPQRREASVAVVTASELAKHTGPASKWLAIDGKVYDVTRFVDSHPGGPIITSALGRDATREFDEFGHSAYARSLLEPLKVGQLLVE